MKSYLCNGDDIKVTEGDQLQVVNGKIAMRFTKTTDGCDQSPGGSHINNGLQPDKGTDVTMEIEGAYESMENREGTLASMQNNYIVVINGDASDNDVRNTMKLSGVDATKTEADSSLNHGQKTSVKYSKINKKRLKEESHVGGTKVTRSLPRVEEAEESEYYNVCGETAEDPNTTGTHSNVQASNIPSQEDTNNTEGYKTTDQRQPESHQRQTEPAQLYEVVDGLDQLAVYDNIEQLDDNTYEDYTTMNNDEQRLYDECDSMNHSSNLPMPSDVETASKESATPMFGYVPTRPMKHYNPPQSSDVTRAETLAELNDFAHMNTAESNMSIPMSSSRPLASPSSSSTDSELYCTNSSDDAPGGIYEDPDGSGCNVENQDGGSGVSQQRNVTPDIINKTGDVGRRESYDDEIYTNIDPSGRSKLCHYTDDDSGSDTSSDESVLDLYDDTATAPQKKPRALKNNKEMTFKHLYTNTVANRVLPC